MLKWLSGKDRAGHALANMADAKALVAMLPPDDAVRAAHDALQWLESITTSASKFSMTHRYALIDLIEAALKRHGQRLLDEYLALKPQAKFQEGLYWRAATGYWKALGDAYVGCIDPVARGERDALALRAKLPQAVARAMRLQAVQIKWILMRYGYVDASYWATVAKLYAQAEAGAFLDDTIDFYEGARGRGTVRQEFLRVLMLSVSSAGGLSPVKQHIAERAIAHFSKDFVFSSSADAGCNFIFDLSGASAPTRVLAATPRGARLIYFGAGQARDAAQRVVEVISATGALPSELNFRPGDCDAVADTVRHLAFNWEKELPQRESERHKVATTLQITQGFEGVLSMGSKVMQETWVVENVSAEGYGVIVPTRRGEWLQVGALIGFRPEGNTAIWGAAVVRRIETDARGRCLVGIQALSRAVTPATMCARRNRSESGTPPNVVLLEAEPSRSGYLQVLVRPASFTLGEALRVTRTADGLSFMLMPSGVIERTADGLSFKLMPSGVIESGPDFERVRLKAG